jgi:cis-3-alkyl-4-acyloxetan-2-one decarboxylase
MHLLDVGAGTPVLVIPGLQGRWEWMEAGLKSLAARARVISFSLADEPSSGAPFDASRGFDNYVEQIDSVLDHARVDAAILCGVSYGGLIALRYAARRRHAVRGLVLASALAPGYTPDRRARFYMSSPGLLFPVFCVDAAWRARPEIRAAFATRAERNGFRRSQVRAALTAPTSPYRMVQRMRLLEGEDFRADAARVRCPALVITGDTRLDRVVPVDSTRAYARLLADVETADLSHTGHLGIVTRPDAFGDLVAGFIDRLDRPRRADRCDTNDEGDSPGMPGHGMMNT